MQGFTKHFSTSLNILFKAEEANSNMLSLFKDAGLEPDAYYDSGNDSYDDLSMEEYFF